MPALRRVRAPAGPGGAHDEIAVDDRCGRSHRERSPSRQPIDPPTRCRASSLAPDRHLQDGRPGSCPLCQDRLDGRHIHCPDSGNLLRTPTSARGLRGALLLDRSPDRLHSSASCLWRPAAAMCMSRPSVRRRRSDCAGPSPRVRRKCGVHRWRDFVLEDNRVAHDHRAVRRLRESRHEPRPATVSEGLRPPSPGHPLAPRRCAPHRRGWRWPWSRGASDSVGSRRSAGEPGRKGSGLQPGRR